MCLKCTPKEITYVKHVPNKAFHFLPESNSDLNVAVFLGEGGDIRSNARMMWSRGRAGGDGVGKTWAGTWGLPCRGGEVGEEGPAVQDRGGGKLIVTCLCYHPLFLPLLPAGRKDCWKPGNTALNDSHFPKWTFKSLWYWQGSKSLWMISCVLNTDI